ncbi:ATP-binding protein [Baaleninema simplex]|uniref:ATP-binding protein n=1 Tax=Baaleninema simplex TaxID=2862350 RepID=UPI0003496962|nr:ATP-binding protein [Baaleninema simplex]
MAATLKASPRGLELVDRARRLKGWLKSSDTWCDAASTSRATLKRFWRGLPIRSQTFIAICEAVEADWKAVVEAAEIPSISKVRASEPTERSPVEPSEPIVDFFAYDEAWVGREHLVEELTQQLRQSCRILVLLGITGIGKTALAERIAVALHDDWMGGEWHYLLRENLENERQAMDFASVATRWWQRWGVPVDNCKDTERLLQRTIDRFLEQPYLLIIDSLELILTGNEDEGWSDFQDPWWAQFFEGVLAAESCPSRIVLTSQDFPGQLPPRYEAFWNCQFVSGLAPEEQLALFAKTELKVSHQDRPYLERIGAAYEGHPLALRVIAGEITNAPFRGNVVAYWKKYGREIEEVENAIAEAKTGTTTSASDRWQLHQCTRHLRLKVRDRLERTFNRLEREARNAYLLLCEASVYRTPVPEDFWLSHLEDWDCDEFARHLALETLRDRYLVEEIVENDRILLRQHNLIRSVSLKHLQQLDLDDGELPR